MSSRKKTTQTTTASAALDTELVPQPVAQAALSSVDARVPAVLATPEVDFPAALLLAIPWGHHAVLMEKVKDAAARHWYMRAAAVDNGWSRHVLHHIDGDSHRRTGRAARNFALRLPSPDSAMVQQTVKAPYLFDFLTLQEPFDERGLETGHRRVQLRAVARTARRLEVRPAHRRGHRARADRPHRRRCGPMSRHTHPSTETPTP